MKKIRWTALLAVLLSAGAASATVWTNTATGDWSTGSNWDTGEPTSAENAYVNNGGTVQVTQAGEEANRIYIGDVAGGSGSLDISGGDLTTAMVLIGWNATGSGTATMSGGTLSTGRFDAGGGGTGSFIQSGGAVTASDLQTGSIGGSTGAYTISGGSLAVSARATIGGAGATGTFTVGGSAATSITVGEKWLMVNASTLNSVIDSGGITPIAVTSDYARPQGTWNVSSDGAVAGTYTIMVAAGGFDDFFHTINLPNDNCSWATNATTLTVTYEPMPDPGIANVDSYPCLYLTNLVARGVYTIQSKGSLVLNPSWIEEVALTATGTTAFWADSEYPSEKFYKVEPVQ